MNKFPTYTIKLFDKTREADYPILIEQYKSAKFKHSKAFLLNILTDSSIITNAKELKEYPSFYTTFSKFLIMQHYSSNESYKISARMEEPKTICIDITNLRKHKLRDLI